jgi:beta-phosphoglucomutase
VQSNKIKLVIFDLDGVLTETSDYHFKAWKALADDLGIKLEDSFESQLKGISRKESLNRILSEHDLDNHYNKNEINKFLDKKNTHYQELISHMTRDHLYEGVIELFNYLKEQKIKIALGSASKNGPRLLKALEISDYFDYVVNPANLRSKPKPDIFIDAMKHFNYQPHQCIGLEDAKAGITAINKAGMLSIGIGDENDLNHAKYCFSSIKTIPIEFFNKLLKGDSS